MQHDPIAFNNLARARRSIFPKQFEPGAAIPDDVVQQILENAAWAPTHKLTQPWQFVVFTGEGLKKFAAFQAEMYKTIAADDFKEDKYEKMLSQPLLASHIIALGMKRNPGVPEVEEVAAVSCAVQNIYLSATAYGYGGYWTTGGVTYMPQARHFFGLGPDDKLLGFFYLGVVKIPSPPGKREPLENKVEWRRG